MLNNNRHPSKYDTKLYRAIQRGGETFIDDYLELRPGEETSKFLARRRMTYLPGYCKSVIQDIVNSIKQRLPSIERSGGSPLYQAAIDGRIGGVDRHYSTMNRFIGTVLEELCFIGEVGIYVDAPADNAETLDQYTQPYIYTYPSEQILNWSIDDTGEYQTLLLLDYAPSQDEYGLTKDYQPRHRLYQRTEEGIVLRIFEEEVEVYSTLLPLTVIPFVHIQLPSPLLKDVGKHQITLLNLASTDVKYAYEGNTVFLAEKYDPATAEEYWRTDDEDDEKAKRKRYLGADRGLRVPEGLDYPRYISPDTAPLEASMKKQEAIRAEIYDLLSQALRSIDGKSDLALGLKDKKEEDGLKAIADHLEWAERKIARIWSEYEGSTPATIFYPLSYQFKSDDQRYTESERLVKLAEKIPSRTAKENLILKALALLMPDGDISKIEEELRSAPGLLSDPSELFRLVGEAVISPKSAALVLGFSEEEADAAALAHAERAKQIIIAQSGAKDLSTVGAENDRKRGSQV